MSVNSISSSHQQIASLQPQVTAPTQQKDSDGDADGSSPVTSATPPVPTTNTSGQTVGTKVNTTA